MAKKGDKKWICVTENYNVRRYRVGEFFVGDERPSHHFVDYSDYDDGTPVRDVLLDKLREAGRISENDPDDNFSDWNLIWMYSEFMREQVTELDKKALIKRAKQIGAKHHNAWSAPFLKKKIEEREAELNAGGGEAA